ncbi:MAG: molybdopterin molybdotransferase MoeA [Bacteroidales bacterium]|jgi:molybdopterin molybdotransferase|nr:molybdopterin molybdotransferase MoeA [Bacteroidales bacterium]HOL98388.1 molybdopterin molybdotransferase MoeA [Bacteroidales bacterium]HOM37281.1 molybdopterin molybdotransferase MoeA [Bacteroidales bacterium]HPD24840.1 molybdopterin molybdotransferase MoeA [Bacteroidales bacterium]HRS99558.1 molybdopterin molybdotransferase MoeA [Bacteroidales bacterium]
MIKHSEALKIVLDQVFRTDIEKIKISDVYGRILAENIYSEINMPPFRKSMVDGFACRKEDLNKSIFIVGEIKAGDDDIVDIGAEQSVKIMTGAKVPDSADIVVPVEEVEVFDNFIKVLNQKSSENISPIGEDIKIGDKLLKAGTLITPPIAGVIASLGFNEVKVHKFPEIGLIVTGDEILEPGNVLTSGKIFNSNAYQLIANIKKIGVRPKYYGIINDSASEIENIIKNAIEDNDICIITGGVSMGDYDFVAPTIKNTGLKVHFDSVAAQPGRPLVFASSVNKFVFGMPGNPVSGFVIFETIVKPLIYKIMNHNFRANEFPFKLAGGLTRKKAQRKSFYPVILNSDKTVSPIKYHGSAHLNSYIDAFGIIAMEEDVYNLNDGDFVNVRLI